MAANTEAAPSSGDERTIKTIMDEMSSEQKDLQALVVGAALDGQSLAGNPEVLAQYDALSEEHKTLIDFLVGHIMAEEDLKHDAMAGEFLSHFGVKGMKWGVIRDKINGPGSLSRSAANTAEGRASARKAVNSGRATLKQTHLASLKSTGHRAINALSGDKTFWRRMAITAGITTGMAAATGAATFLLPAGILGAIGGTGIAAAQLGSISSAFTTTELGIWTVAMAGSYSAAAVAVGGTAANVVGNTARAAAGNSLINRSYDRLGKTMVRRQKTGKQRVAQVLGKAGKTVAGIRDKDLLQDNMSSDEFLSHYHEVTLKEMELGND